MREARKSGKFTPGQAAKLYGMANFLEHGLLGRIGLGEIQALKEHQYGGSSRANASLLVAFDVLEAIISMRPRRELMVLPVDVPRVVAASDAALEAPRQGSGGYHLVFQDGGVQIREAFVAIIPAQTYDMWGPGDHKIAQLELFMVVHALTARPDQFRGRRGVWFIDNIASLMCLIRGRSDNPDLAKMATYIQCLLFALRASLYWEYIPSKSNWADAISRLGPSDPWYRANHFKLNFSLFPPALLRLPYRAVITFAEFL